MRRAFKAWLDHLRATGANGIDLTPEELVQALTPVDGAPLHFAVRGSDDCHFQPYWALGREEITCFPTLK